MKIILLIAFVTVTSSVPVWAQSGTNDSVPVRVSYFSAVPTNNKIKLNWKVVCFLQYANFDVQRSTNGSDYTTINTFTADRLRCQSPFVFDDVQPDVRTFYRLKVGDKDGNFSTSKVLVAFGKEKSFEINSITPNPITGNTLLSISSAENDKINISISNYSGVLVKRIQTKIAKGVTDINLKLDELSKGLYNVSVINSSLDVRTIKIFKL